MKADYFRYVAEFKTGEEKNDAADQSLKSYEIAYEAARDNLSATNPVRLGLALNYSVFYYEIMNSVEKACRVAKGAFDDAAAKLSTAGEELTKDCILLLQMHRENISNWEACLPDGTIGSRSVNLNMHALSIHHGKTSGNVIFKATAM